MDGKTYLNSNIKKIEESNINRIRQNLMVGNQKYQMLPPETRVTGVRFEHLDKSFSNFFQASSSYKRSSLEDKVRLNEMIQTKVIHFHNGKEIYMGGKVNNINQANLHNTNSQNISTNNLFVVNNSSLPKNNTDNAPTKTSSINTKIVIPLKMNSQKATFKQSSEVFQQKMVSSPGDSKKKLLGNKREQNPKIDLTLMKSPPLRDNPPQNNVNIINYNFTNNIYGGSNINNSSAVNQKTNTKYSNNNKIEKEAQLLNEIIVLLLNGGTTDNLEEDVTFSIDHINYTVKKVLGNIRSLKIHKENSEHDLTYTTKNEIYRELSKIKQLLEQKNQLSL